MSCTHFEERWDDFLAGTLSEVEQRAAAAHLDGCTDCAALVAALRDAVAALPAAASPQPGADVAVAVLALTSGGACSAAQALLCDLADDLLPAGDRDLVASHLAHCARCTALHATLVYLARALPTLAAFDPGPDLTRAIVAATSAPAPPREPARWRRVVADRWRHLVARPRFAWEAAYVGLLLVVGLFGTSVSPFRDVPPRALAVVQLDPFATARSAGGYARALHGYIGAMGQGAWDLTGAAIGRRVAVRADEWADTHPGAHEAYGNLHVHMGEMRQRIGERNLGGASLSLQAVRGDLRALWHSASGGSAVTSDPP